VDSQEGRYPLSANPDLVRSIYARWERGDFSSTEWAHPEIEYVTADGPSPDTSTGLAGMADATREWMTVWQDWRVEAEEYRELDDERVLVLVRYGGRGKTSGMEIAQVRTTGATLFHISGGKVTRLVFYLDRDRAIAELGLATEADSP
jgi:ketosteroid isomerase-like protein